MSPIFTTVWFKIDAMIWTEVLVKYPCVKLWPNIEKNNRVDERIWTNIWTWFDLNDDRNVTVTL